MEFFRRLLNLFKHLNDVGAWNHLIEYVGTGNLYLVLFAIVFCETGLVVMPFLPGDSLLFAIGAVGHSPSAPYSVTVAGALLIAAALCGDNVNYWLGRTLGPAVFSAEDGGAKSLRSRLLNKKHLERTQAFYEKYGPKMVIMARFVPIVRTFAPFVAGVGRMNYARFLIFSVVGAVLWVTLCMGAGYLLGGIEFVQKRFEVIILAIIVISVLPMVIEFWKHRREAKLKGFDVSSGQVK